TPPRRAPARAGRGTSRPGPPRAAPAPGADRLCTREARRAVRPPTAPPAFPASPGAASRPRAPDPSLPRHRHGAVATVAAEVVSAVNGAPPVMLHCKSPTGLLARAPTPLAVHVAAPPLILR